MAMKKKGYRNGGKVKKMRKGGAAGGMKKPRMMKKGGAAGGVMTLAQLRKAASAKGMKLVKK